MTEKIGLYTCSGHKVACGRRVLLKVELRTDTLAVRREAGAQRDAHAARHFGADPAEGTVARAGLGGCVWDSEFLFS